MAEFIGIIMMVLALVVFTMFNRVSQGRSALSSAESSLKGIKGMRAGIGASSIMKTTVNGVSLLDQAAILWCYREEVFNGVNITESFSSYLNKSFIPGKWSVEVSNQDYSCSPNPCWCIAGGNLYKHACNFNKPFNKEAVEFIAPKPCSFDGVVRVTLYLWMENGVRVS